MHFLSYAVIACSLLSTASAHAVITAVTGANGVNGEGFGVVDGTPRDTDKPTRVVEVDTSIIRDRDIKKGKADNCGRTPGAGNNDIAAELQKATTAGLPTVDANGALTMTLHQVNGDGAGPFTCEVSTDGGQTFSAVSVTQNVPGTRGRSRNKATDFPLVAAVPAGTTCAGGPDGNACIMRCRNPSLAGPFGGCVAFAMDDAAAAGNSTAEAAAAASTDTAAAAASAAAATADAGSTDVVGADSVAAAAPAAAATGAAALSKAAKKGAVAQSIKGAKKGGATTGSSKIAARDLSAVPELLGRNNLGGARVAGGFLRAIRELGHAQH